MRLILAEKPSLARAIAAAIPGEHRRSQHHIECSTGDVVAWCAGHVLELAPPEDYSPELKAWAFETLPIVPDGWKHRVSSRELVRAIGTLLARATRVVHAGDPDREGQLLVDEVLLHLGWRGPTDRLLITDLRPAAVKVALDSLEPNARFAPLYEEALARQRADWLYGLNLTRLYTLRARLAGYRGVLSVGRVQTPVLGLIVRRDRDIERFVAKPFYAVETTLRTSDGAEFPLEWAVGKEHEASVDAEGRLVSRPLADAVALKVAGRPGVVTEHDEKPHAEAAPRPYSLADLQIDAGRKLGLSAAQVLEIAQRLYERQLITYPRSDCSYLPEGHLEQAREVLDAVRRSAPRLAEACAAADSSRRSKAWDDRKVTAHHAIIPTAQPDAAPLEGTERSLYELVARRYVQQFLPPHEYLQTSVAILVTGETFKGRGRRVTALGWKAIDALAAAGGEAPDAEDADADEHASVLPRLSIGERVLCRSARVVEKRTQPPKPFTDATLIQAMCNVARFVSDPQTKKILQDADGIGTPATRAAIIEILFERTYVERRKKQIRSTPIGRALIDALPTAATSPDTTAVWESAMRRINARQIELGRFLGAVTGQIGALVAQGKAAGPLPLPAVVAQTASSARPRARGKARAKQVTRRPRSAAGRPGNAAGRAKRVAP